MQPDWHALLITKRDELMTRRPARREGLQAQHHADVMDDAVAMEDAHKAVILSNADTDTLLAVNEALNRIANGSYAECVDCCEVIPTPRLIAIPWADRCARCQGVAETAAFDVGPSEIARKDKLDWKVNQGYGFREYRPTVRSRL